MKFIFIIFVFLLSKNLFAHENICKTPYQEEFFNDYKITFRDRCHSDCVIEECKAQNIEIISPTGELVNEPMRKYEFGGIYLSYELFHDFQISDFCYYSDLKKICLDSTEGSSYIIIEDNSGGSGGYREYWVYEIDKLNNIKFNEIIYTDRYEKEKYDEANN